MSIPLPEHPPRPLLRLFLIVVISAAIFLALATSLVGCGSARIPGEDPPSLPPLPPAERLPDPPLRCEGPPCSDANPCLAGAACIDHVCLPSSARCQTDLDCHTDTRCVRGHCVGFSACAAFPPFRPTCRSALFPIDALTTIAPLCHFSEVNVTSLPVLADLDGDQRPEILALGTPNQIIALSPGTCQPLFVRSFPLLSDGASQPAVADLDGDTHPEIILLDAEHHVVVLDHRAQLLARAESPVSEKSLTKKDLWSAPAIANLDGRPGPEILAGAQVLRYVPRPVPHLDVVWSQPSLAATWGSLSLIADLDADGLPEAVTSDRIYAGATGEDRTPPTLADQPFYPQVADFDLDGLPELLLVEPQLHGQTVRIVDPRTRKILFGPYNAGEHSLGGPAVIADLDGDAVPDFALAGHRYLYAYALRCAQQPLPVGCAAPGLLFFRLLSDDSSGSAGVSAFDFNADGLAELIVRDECWLRILSGLDGHTLAAYTVSSSTGLELPTVGDLNGDGTAELVVASDVDIDRFGACRLPPKPEADTGTPWTGHTRGLLVFADPAHPFAPARRVFNQHTYHVSNIADDLTVPDVEVSSWSSGAFNTYRTALDPARVAQARPLVDLTVTLSPLVYPPRCSDPWPLVATVCNRGAAALTTPAPLTFYTDDPAQGGQVICTASPPALSPGACAPVGCAWSPPPTGRVSLHVRLNDDGHGAHPLSQCRTDNDTAHLNNLACFRPPA